jgi:hypothetical protein
VAAYNSSTNRCTTGGFQGSPTDLFILVACATATGAAVDTQFTASFTRPGAGAEMGFVLARLFSGGSQTPHPSVQFNSTGAVNTVQRDGPGSYVVTMPGLGAASTRHVTVTPFNGTTNGCIVNHWVESAGNRIIRVNCFTFSGTPADTMFTPPT